MPSLSTQSCYPYSTISTFNSVLLTWSSYSSRIRIRSRPPKKSKTAVIKTAAIRKVRTGLIWHFAIAINLRISNVDTSPLTTAFTKVTHAVCGYISTFTRRNYRTTAINSASSNKRAPRITARLKTGSKIYVKVRSQIEVTIPAEKSDAVVKGSLERDGIG
jgi:hypothetical protein